MSNLIKSNQIKPTGVVLTQKDFDKINELKKENSKDDIVFDHTHSDLTSLNHLSLDTLIIALYRPEDITIQQTVEEQLLYTFEKNKEVFEENGEQYCNGILTGMITTLHIIGMKVKGINE